MQVLLENTAETRNLFKKVRFNAHASNTKIYPYILVRISKNYNVDHRHTASDAIFEFIDIMPKQCQKLITHEQLCATMLLKDWDLVNMFIKSL